MEYQNLCTPIKGFERNFDNRTAKNIKTETPKKIKAPNVAFGNRLDIPNNKAERIK